MTKSKYDWMHSNSDREAIEDMLDYHGDSDVIHGSEVLDAVLRWHGYGMSVGRLIDLYEIYIKDQD